MIYEGALPEELPTFRSRLEARRDQERLVVIAQQARAFHSCSKEWAWVAGLLSFFPFCQLALIGTEFFLMLSQPKLS